MPESQPLSPEPESKSKRKEKSLALQKIGEALAKLTNEQLSKIPLPDNLLRAIHEFKLLKSHEARRRQMQYIGKLMRTVNPEGIEQTLKDIQFVYTQNTVHFQSAETWRAQLISQGDVALNLFLAEYLEGDRQHLRQLIRKAQHDQKTEKNTGAAKALFKYVLMIIEKK